MSVSELKQRLHFAIHEVGDEKLLKSLLSLAESSRPAAEKNSPLIVRESKEEFVRGREKTVRSSAGGFSLKDKYYFEDRAF